MKPIHRGMFLACSFFAALAIAAVFCSVALVAIVGNQISLAELPLIFIQTTAISWSYIVVLRYLFEPVVWLAQKCKNLSFKALGGRLPMGVASAASAEKDAQDEPSTGMVTTFSRLTTERSR